MGRQQGTEHAGVEGTCLASFAGLRFASCSCCGVLVSCLARKGGGSDRGAGRGRTAVSLPQIPGCVSEG